MKDKKRDLEKKQEDYLHKPHLEVKICRLFFTATSGLSFFNQIYNTLIPLITLVLACSFSLYMI